jgi:hypothetical protein
VLCPTVVPAEIHVYPHLPAVPAWPVGRSPFDEDARSLREPVGRVHLAGDYVYGSHGRAAAQSAGHVARQVDAALRAERQSLEIPG